ncbi:MAG: DNA repair protein RadA [Candidatus Saccharimonadales bacterium]
MKKSSVRFVCRSCGAASSTWSGRCYNCGEWNTLEEEIQAGAVNLKQQGQQLKVAKVSQVASKQQGGRLPTGLNDIDIVLGGGFVKGSVSLMAGEPGIGKSTLLLQIAQALATNHAVLYVSGEESAHQLGLRAARLGANSTKLMASASNSADDIAATIASGDYQLAIVDSIQTITCAAVSSAPGSVSQITNSTHLLSTAAKQSNTALIMVGHVTKEGSIAGPKVLEHLVDVVLQLEGDRYGGFKVLRGVKNRYGSTNEVAILEMQDIGLMSVKNPSAALLAERQISDGSVVLATMEGSRPILVEVQALVNKTAYGYPKRTASGIDLNRVNLLIAMLERRTKLNLSDQDIYINIVGGIRITEPAADLAVCLAIGSAAKGLMLKQNAVVFGEVGLSGEVRHVPFIEKRVEEARKLGFDAAIGPKVKVGKSPKLLTGVSTVREALNQFLEKD